MWATGCSIDGLRLTLLQDGYTLSHYAKLSYAHGRFRTSFRREAFSDGSHPLFHTLATAISQSLGQAVLADQVHSRSEDRDSLLGLIEEHITQNIVKVCSDPGLLSVII